LIHRLLKFFVTLTQRAQENGRVAFVSLFYVRFENNLSVYRLILDYENSPKTESLYLTSLTINILHKYATFLIINKSVFISYQLNSCFIKFPYLSKGSIITLGLSNNTNWKPALHENVSASWIWRSLFPSLDLWVWIKGVELKVVPLIITLMIC
jgi:hypothetical protein